ncbi:MAG: hypothetical protein B9S33_18285 [Pedosphaera sp. Tous-C6FEB]|nr:MAG: hypothetical protein B9S33_18285 [Pedosphaera sp. Tous-C6FEB]
MHNSALLRGLADLVLVTHVAFVAFVILSLLLILVGGFRHWHWIRNPWFRLSHLGAIGIVVGQAWLGVICPLTTLEMWLRGQAGDDTYEGTFMSHWLHQLLFYQAPPWVFIAGYTVFGLLVVGTWFSFRPRPFRTSLGSCNPPSR